MPINSDKPRLWKADVERSIDYYNDWFIRFAPETYRTQRKVTTSAVLDAFHKTENLTGISPSVLHKWPGLLPILRMVTAPPLARDRLMGLAHVSKSLIDTLEGKEETPPRLPRRMPKPELMENLQKLCDVLADLVDDELLPWVAARQKPGTKELARAATVIADRMCGAASDPIIRNAQEKRQLSALGRWLRRNGYHQVSTKEARDPFAMPAGTFTFRLSLTAGEPQAPVKIPIDCVVKPLNAQVNTMPILIEAKSAGDATNTNKRRKEEAQKLRQLRSRYGDDVVFMLYLCGYFEPGYLGYEAAEGIDWVWEHRTDDFCVHLAQDHKKKAWESEETLAIYGAGDSEIRERERLAAQNETDASKSPEERNRLGQFSTPYPIASQIVARSLNAMPHGGSITFLEPALGSGVFFSALLRQVPVTRIARATGCEIDTSYGDIAHALWVSSGLRVVPGDFVEFATQHENSSQYSLLCTNPPYVRHHHLPSERKQALQALVMQRLGMNVSGLSGLYVYFVLLADALLADGGIASWLLPAEFLYVNYGSVLREYLSSRVTLLAMHHFNPDNVQFDDALVSSCIITYRKTRPAKDTSCEVSYGDYLAPEQRRSVPLSEFRMRNKWTLAHFENVETFSGAPRLKDLFSVRRGIATGANDFFIIDGETATRYDIPKAFLKPILPSPRYLRESIIRATADGLPDVSDPRYLLDCLLPPDVVRNHHPGLWRYLETGVARGIPEGCLCAKKEVWYYQERRDAAPFLASYMGRSSNGRTCPIRFFVNFSDAIVTNGFLNLYPTAELAARLENAPARMLELGAALNNVPAECVMQAGRAYGGGLHKIEPRELLELQLPSVPDWLADASMPQLALI